MNLRVCRIRPLLATLFLLSAAFAAAEEPTPWWLAQPIRGVWVANVGSESLDSVEDAQRTVATCKAAGINTLFVVTWNRGYTLYPSEVMRREFGVTIDPRLEGRDPLAELIEAAHAEGLRVVAWFEFGFSCSYQKPDGGPLLKKHPEWAALDRQGRLVSRNGFQWMNAFDPAVQEFLLEMLKEAVQNYDLDGVQGDDRLPALPNTAGYDPLTVSLYQAEHGGADPPTNAYDRDWTQWRADRLSRFVERSYSELKQLDPDLCVSWAPSVYPWSLQNYLQDWPRWLREGWGDLFCPQVYRKTPQRYAETLKPIAASQVAPADRVKVAPGVLMSLADGYQLPTEDLAAMLRANREAGFEGEVFFYYDGLKQHAELFQELYTK
ncbi:glycoside hydrolase family 10 protein [Botrimarina hoheduenensis]|uniref:Glycosyl hydrolase-like 10 domain-containing protein n=1 Tax=Botrimarina hoheduenensis TaxID=2528000 RepID=A0A5C5WE09_9BACT|nr:family 10 glycosylhydrolase [Botrimarina hoheduenensis]TWT48285.1 hypothetical protein Pla111_00470 [Botrimarina hoheduenensis]